MTLKGLRYRTQHSGREAVLSLHTILFSMLIGIRSRSYQLFVMRGFNSMLKLIRFSDLS